MNDQQDDLNELYRKVFQGSASPGDKEKLVQWMAGLDIRREDISEATLADEQRRSRLALHERFNGQQARVRHLRPWMAAASVAAVLLGGLLVWKINFRPPAKVPDIRYADIYTKAGERKMVTLQDSSRIVLNSSTHLRYPLNAGNQARKVYLEGQAYFDVRHDNGQPFIVYAGKLEVRVLGTSFDVSNYTEDKDASVTVASGKVAVAVPAAAAHTLLPGEQLTYDKKNGVADEHTVDASAYLSWQKGAQVFRNKELREVCRSLERNYGVKIHIKTPALEKQKMNLRTKGTEDIAGVLKMLAVTGEFRYSIKDTTIVLWK
ncbi:FecR family protein [Chitinophaga barathri]|nr:FecR domain-containing protein [Chitinophaga barathri]